MYIKYDIYIRYFEWALTLQQGWFKSNQQIVFSWRNEDFTPDFTWINHGIHGTTRGIGGKHFYHEPPLSWTCSCTCPREMHLRRKDVQTRWWIDGWLPQNMQMSTFWRSQMSRNRLRRRGIKRSEPEDIHRFRCLIWKSYILFS
jgi:hypothetical protein